MGERKYMWVHSSPHNPVDINRQQYASQSVRETSHSGRYRRYLYIYRALNEIR